MYRVSDDQVTFTVILTLINNRIVFGYEEQVINGIGLKRTLCPVSNMNFLLVALISRSVNRSIFGTHELNIGTPFKWTEALVVDIRVSGITLARYVCHFCFMLGEVQVFGIIAVGTKGLSVDRDEVFRVIRRGSLFL